MGDTTVIQWDKLVADDMLKMYAIGPPIGHGATCAVFKGTNTQTNAQVAIKQICLACGDEAGVPMQLIREITTQKKAACPEIATLHEAHIKQLSSPQDTFGNAVATKFAPRRRMIIAWIVIEYLPMSLSHAIRSGMLDESASKYATKCLASAVSRLHSLGIMHRDIKPDNIMCTPSGAVKLCDFGLAKNVGSTMLNGELNMTRQMVTRWYRPPEVLMNSSTYSLSTDIWSVGCVVYEMMFKRPLFMGTTEADTLREIVECLGVTKDFSDLAASLSYGNGRNFYMKSETIEARCTKMTFSPGLKTLFNETITYTPAKRATASQMLTSKWFNELPRPSNFTLLEIMKKRGDI